TAPFNADARNRQVADDYAIVMGSSHAEPMLRNNVGEWPHDKAADWNPVTNLPAILDYWEQRVRENAKFESTWTLGMRGVHDSGNGIYYHLSYTGRPHDYLWLESIPPALVWEEMTKAYARGVRQLWVVNVGGIKPIEAGMTLFLQMGWDVNRYGADVQK